MKIQKEALSTSELNNTSPINQKEVNKKRLIFEVHEGHNSKQTADKYRTSFKLFLDYIKIYDLDVFLDLGREAIQELVIKYTKSLRDDPDKKYKRSTVHNRIAPIIYFLENNDIELNKRKIRRYLPPDESTNDDRPYTLEEIQKLLSVCDLRTKIMVLLLASSGMRIGALHWLMIGDLTQVIWRNKGNRVYKIWVYARTRDKYFTFCSPECAKVIDEYLNYRKRCGEELKDESPLFRRQFNRFSINKPLPISQPSVMEAIDESLKRSGVKSNRTMRSHAFRKGFKTICEQSGMKSINVELLLGHSIGVSNHYYRPLESDVLEDYMTHAADTLTISNEHRLKNQIQQQDFRHSEEWQALREEIRELRKFVYPGPMPRDKQMRKTYIKHLK